MTNTTNNDKPWKKSAKNGSSHAAVITASGKKLYEAEFVQNSDLTASFVKSTAVSSGGMAFECLEVGISEILMFISISYGTVLWIGLQLVPNKSRCLFAINLFLQTAWLLMQVGHQQHNKQGTKNK